MSENQITRPEWTKKIDNLVARITDYQEWVSEQPGFIRWLFILPLCVAGGVVLAALMFVYASICVAVYQIAELLAVILGILGLVAMIASIPIAQSMRKRSSGYSRSRW